MPLRLRELAKLSPDDAVVASFREIESTLRGLVDGTDLGSKRPIIELVKNAVDSGVISQTTSEAIHQLRRLRNLAAHDHTDISYTEALEYIAIADAVMYALDARKPGVDTEEAGSSPNVKQRCSTTDISTRAIPGLPLHRPHRTAREKPSRPDVKHQVRPQRQASAGTGQCVTLRCCRIWLYGIKAPPAAARTWLSWYSSRVPARADPACCARPGGRARAGRPGGGDGN